MSCLHRWQKATKKLKVTANTVAEAEVDAIGEDFAIEYPAAMIAVSAGLTLSAEDVSGSKFTGNASYASKLDQIFAGNIGLYTSSSVTQLA